MPSRRELLEQEVQRLHAEAAVLEREWRRAPWLFATIAAAIPVHFLWGPAAAVYSILFAPCLVVTALYLVGVRRAENRANSAELERQLRDMA